MIVIDKICMVLVIFLMIPLGVLLLVYEVPAFIWLMRHEDVYYIVQQESEEGRLEMIENDHC